MGSETIILVVLIVGFFAITIFSLIAMMIIRRREQSRDHARHASEAIEQLDAALNAALAEMNKTGSLLRNEINETYNAMLFLYNLLDEKHKEVEAAALKVDQPEIVESFKPEPIRNEPFEIKMSRNTSNVVDIVPVIADRLDTPLPSQLFDISEEIEEELNEDTPPALLLFPQKKRPTFANPKHELIWEMREHGMQLPDIAKDLGMGQGEVKLILDLADRA